MIYLYYYLISCSFVFQCYYFMDKILTYKSDRYRKLKYVKKTYVFANIVKSIILLFITPYCVIFLYNLYFGMTEELYHSIFIATSIYASTDMNSLLFEKGKKNSTIYHHILVQLATFTAFYCGPFNKMTDVIIIYGSFSTFAYLVNFYLAIRFLFEKDMYEIKLLATFTQIIYMLSCIVNWCLQLYYLVLFMTLKNYFAVFILAFFNCVVISDDILLINFLNNNSFMNKLKLKDI